MDNKKQILEFCEEVVKNGGAFGVNCCDDIPCGDCPLSIENREDGMRCCEDDEATVRIAKEYIGKNKGYYKVREIIENIGLFEVGTKFSLFEMDVLSIGENETIIFEGNMNNELDLNLVLKVEYPKKERVVTFEELKVGDIFTLRKEDRDNEDVLVVQLAETIDALGSDNIDRYDVLPKNKMVGWDIVLIENS